MKKITFTMRDDDTVTAVLTTCNLLRQDHKETAEIISETETFLRALDAKNCPQDIFAYQLPNLVCNIGWFALALAISKIEVSEDNEDKAKMIFGFTEANLN